MRYLAQKETRSHLLRRGKPQRYAGKHVELAVRTAANWKRNWLREGACSGSSGRTEKRHVCARKGQPVRLKAEKAVWTRRMKLGAHPDCQPSDSWMIN